MKRTVLSLVVCFVAVIASAQGLSLSDKLYVSMSADVTTKSKGFTSYEAGAQLGYKFTPSLYAFAEWSGGRSVYEKDGLKTHGTMANLGGGLGYRLFLDKNSNGSFDFKGSVTTTIGDRGWKNTIYKAGVYYRLPALKVAPQLGLGYQYIDSRINGVESRGCIFASLGFSL